LTWLLLGANRGLGLVVPGRALVEGMVPVPLPVLVLALEPVLVMVDARGQRRGMAGKRESGPGLENRATRRE